jgi:RHS repeat-associated protein
VPPVIPALPNYQIVEKSYVLDYTSALKDVIMESENQGLTFRYAYGLEKYSVAVSGLGFDRTKAFFHHDRLGSVDFTTDDFGGNVLLSYVSYDPWGVPASVLPWAFGSRKIDLVAEYTGHPYDVVLGMYFAEARMYDAADRRFAAGDPVKGNLAKTLTLTTYLYVVDNPYKWFDPFSLTEVPFDGKTFVATREISDERGYSVDWDEKSKQTSVFITETFAITFNVSDRNIFKEISGISGISGNVQYKEDGEWTTVGTIPVVYKLHGTSFLNSDDIDYFIEQHELRMYYEKFICDFKPRSEWGAETHAKRDIEYFEESPEDYYDTIVIHHTTRPLNEEITKLQKTHFKKSEEYEIGYHFVIDENGIVYEDRPIEARGAHVGGANTGKIGIALMGNFQPSKDLFTSIKDQIQGAVASDPTTPQKDVLLKLVNILKEKYDTSYIGGHRDFANNPTDCPGDNLYSFMKSNTLIQLP